MRSGRRLGLRYAAPPALPPCAHARHRWHGAQRARRFRWNVGSAASLLSPLRYPLHFVIAPLSAANTPTEAVTGSDARGKNFEPGVAKSGKTETVLGCRHAARCYRGGFYGGGGLVNDATGRGFRSS